MFLCPIFVHSGGRLQVVWGDVAAVCWHVDQGLYRSLSGLVRGVLMTLARTWAVALTGISGHLVAVEADLAAGLPGTTVIGMGDAAVTQARERIRAAVMNSGHRWPDRRITLALSPAALPKRGAGYDIALAVAVLAAAGVVPVEAAGQTVLIGELGLDGQVRPVRGVLPALLAARAVGRERAIVPVGNLSEAALATGMSVWGVASLRDLVASLTGESQDLIPGVAARAGGQLVGSGSGGCAGTAGGEAGVGVRRGGWSSPGDDRAAGGWEDHAGNAFARCVAGRWTMSRPSR